MTIVTDLELKSFPKVEFADHIPLEGWFDDGEGKLYKVSRLIEMTKNLPIFEVPLAGLNLSHKIWDDMNMHMLAFHIMATNNADLSYPIILDWYGNVADGRHRILKALTLGHTTIKCVRMDFKPEYDKLAD